MACTESIATGGGRGDDRVQGALGQREFDASATAWLIGQAVRYLNTADKEGEFAYQRVVELLGHRNDLSKAVVDIVRRAPGGDSPLRWCLLHVLGDAGGADAAEYLVRAALDKLPDRNTDHGCEGPHDTELLVRTMAVHALGKIATRHPKVKEQVLEVVSQRPERAVLIEAAKIAVELGLGEKVRELLPKEQHWILDIRKARIEEFFAESERKDVKERGFTPPRTGAYYTAPRMSCCNHEERRP